VRIAALYDVHGNLSALDAVLAELERELPDAIVVGGDIVAGPMPSETLARVRSLDRASVIRGNADRIALEHRSGNRGAEEGIGDWVARRLTDEDAEYLERLPETVTLDVDGLGPTCFCHATPRDDDEIFTERDGDELVGALLAGTVGRTIVCGHTHVQFDRRVGPWRVVNAGSVGMSFDTGPGARWAMLGPDVDLRVTPYDTGEALRLFRATAGERAAESNVVRALLEPRTREQALDAFEAIAAEQRRAVRG
jgi:predicted phosphodiesterase